MTKHMSDPSSAEMSAAKAARGRPIVLVGLMGVGKSTIGKRLAARLARRFTDVDDEIERAAQRSITEIFDEFGEAHFRTGERRVIARLIEGGAGVIATGGGAFVDEGTRALILEKAIAIWINSSIATLVERTGRRNTRPLLREGDPEEILTRLARQREPYYSQAHIHVESDHRPHETTVEQIIERLAQWT